MTELTEDEFEQLLNKEREKLEYENEQTLLFKLIQALENDETMTVNGAKALARAYELRNRRIE